MSSPDLEVFSFSSVSVVLSVKTSWVAGEEVEAGI